MKILAGLNERSVGYSGRSSPPAWIREELSSRYWPVLLKRDSRREHAVDCSLPTVLLSAVVGLPSGAWAGKELPLPRGCPSVLLAAQRGLRRGKIGFSARSTGGTNVSVFGSQPSIEPAAICSYPEIDHNVGHVCVLRAPGAPSGPHGSSSVSTKNHA